VLDDGGKKPVERAPAPPLTAADLDGVKPIAVRWNQGPIVSLAALTAAAPAQLDAKSHERVFREVLRTWDFADRDGWQSALADAMPAEPGLDRAELAAALAAFADSDRRRQLADAAELWRDVEFLFASPMSENGPTLHGRIDLLWRDATGDWHILAWVASSEANGDPWVGRKRELLAAAWAVQRQTGAWPASVGLFNFGERSSVSLKPNERAARAALRFLA
jgi:hypothetical protein